MRRVLGLGPRTPGKRTVYEMLPQNKSELLAIRRAVSVAGVGDAGAVTNPSVSG